MSKIILKTALITVAALIVAALAIFGAWILCSPATMATACERTGNYSFALTCADMQYNRTKSISDLARCAEDSVLVAEDEKIVKYCGMLTGESGFDAVCRIKDAELSENAYGKYRSDYKAYICGTLAAAYYRTGEISAAVDAAAQGGNAASFSKLVIEIADKRDKPTANRVLEIFATYDGDGDARLGFLKNLLESISEPEFPVPIP